MAAMRDPTAARRYLESMLPLGHWAAASYAIGRDHAYIQQYIRRGVPRWLAEADREVLVSVYPHLDAEQLRPPQKLANLRVFQPRGVKGDKKAKRHVKIPGELQDDPRAAQLLRVFNQLPSHRRDTLLELAVEMREIFADRSSDTGAMSA